LDVCPANANVFRPIFINRVAGKTEAEVLSSHQWRWPASAFATEGQPNWVVSGDGLFAGQSITQLLNTVPTAVDDDCDLVCVDLSATLSVNDNNFDDDIGFIFGAANQSSLYVAQWKKRDQSPVSLRAESTWALPNSGAGLRVLLPTGPNGRLQSNYGFARVA
jgi:hypothetical protein